MGRGKRADRDCLTGPRLLLGAALSCRCSLSLCPRELARQSWQCAKAGRKTESDRDERESRWAGGGRQRWRDVCAHEKPPRSIFWLCAVWRHTRRIDCLKYIRTPLSALRRMPDQGRNFSSCTQRTGISGRARISSISHSFVRWSNPATARSTAAFAPGRH